MAPTYSLIHNHVLILDRLHSRGVAASVLDAVGAERQSMVECVWIMSIDSGELRHIHTGSPRTVAQPQFGLLRALLSPGERAVILHNHPSGNTAASDRDAEASADLAQLGLGFGIIGCMSFYCAAPVARETMRKQKSIFTLNMLVPATAFMPGHNVPAPCH